MSGSDDEQEVGRKSVGQRRDDARPRVDAHHQEHQPHGRHGKKEERGRGVEDFDDLPHASFHQLGRIGHVYQVGRHSAEHAPRPLGVFACFEPHLRDVSGHPFVLDHIVLRQRFAPELGSEIGGRDHEKEQQGRCCGQQPCGEAFR